MLSRITGPLHRGYNGGSEESGNEDGLHSGKGRLPAAQLLCADAAL